ncbi:glutamine synthetase [Oculatella sp. FACHB-28]|uniref:glutamine synthetase family protein n=1 Tax=Oculatella sp. FACHB-28 TaxID=2692845 RepID=UPI001686EB5C|nr:glutamine synthetase family protein [Oculatella sp. FACHB-28]MBD2057098.1 glutamine synthetase [Oculatella sp. FACHB-28]
MENQLPDLDLQNVRFVRLLWCDNANVIRGKAFHTRFLAEHQKHGIGISMAQQAIPVMYDAVAPGSGLGPVGEAWLAPDWSTFNPLPYAPGHARVMGDLVTKGVPWVLCPRGFLRRMIAAAAVEGLEIIAAFENEFYLLQSAGLNAERDAKPIPVDHTVFASTLGMDLNQTVIDAIADALIAQKIPVERYYPESGPGQHEISIRYTHALQAADWQIAFRETVRGVALRHGLRASFLPKIFVDQAGSGCHLHLSLWRDGQNLLPDVNEMGELSPIAKAFVAGILHHLPALMALTTPSPNSYRRLQPHFWSGAFRCWGVDNREAAVRVPRNPVPPSPTHFELKTVDASANPYLALGVAIAAGLDGIRRRLDPGEPISVDPGSLPAAERQQRGIDRLPENLGEAIAHLQQDEVLLQALEPALAQAFLAVRTAEWEAMKQFTLEEEVKLLLERY